MAVFQPASNGYDFRPQYPSVVGGGGSFASSANLDSVGGSPSTSAEPGGIGGALWPSAVSTFDKPAASWSPVTGIYHLAPLQKDAHRKLTAGTPMFMYREEDHMNDVFSEVIPLWNLNFRLEQAAIRAKLRPLNAPRTKRPYEEEDETPDSKFPVTIDEFHKSVSFVGFHVSSMNYNDQDNYSSYDHRGRVVATINHKGLSSRVANKWEFKGTLQNGDEVGYVAMHTVGLFDKRYDIDGMELESESPSYDYLQVVPARQTPSGVPIVFPCRPEHYAQGFGSLSYDTVVEKRPYSMQFSKNPQRKTRLDYTTDFRFITRSEGYYMRVGRVLKTNNKSVSRNQVRQALRDFNVENTIKSSAWVMLDVTPLAGLDRIVIA